MENVFHEGEKAVQEKTREKAIGEKNGRIIINKLIPAAINFIENQPFCFVSSKSTRGEISVSALAGEVGYLKVKDEETIEIFPSKIHSNHYDVFWENIKKSPKTGFIFIESATRRRFRMNGRVRLEKDKIVVHVDQAFPNCPKYIQQGEVRILDKPIYYPETLTGKTLTPGIQGIIKKADTFYVGSSSLDGDMDVSHRGGLPGFVQIEDEQTILIPDFPGNSMYNTLGNILLNPNTGLLFHDFLEKKSLQLSGTAAIFFNDEHKKFNTGGTSRYWSFKVSNWILSENLKALDWKLISYSPFNPS